MKEVLKDLEKSEIIEENTRNRNVFRLTNAKVKDLPDDKIKGRKSVF